MNPAEEKLFERDDWWRRDGAFRLLHDINPHRLRWLQSVSGDLSGKRLLDVGCGGGIFAEAAARAGADVTGIDSSANAIQVAQRHAEESALPIAYRRQEGVGGEAAGTYDMVSCFELLEHVAQPSAMVADIATLLAPGGTAFFSTINQTARAWALMVVGLEVILRDLPVGTHQYQRFIRPAALADMCRRCDLSVVNVAGLRYSFFGRCYLLDEQDTSVNYFLAARRASHE